ncbi:B12 binding protein [Tumebacillus sp. BK434]|uniref:MerR family transcriptional regulator n=1 Tax=Tumebacillus sp. BK434 TaxID=2512169 RepID=UPI001047B8EE|nr:MerR family transcriptional regulator [Tumebacillus sp. BK434]TCP58117.1 B12 binding protein [Tumebacillus sp. BK434]
MYNIKSVAQLLNMPAVTIRAWERRYQVVNPVRSESGHRLYSEQDIEDLRWLKVQTEEKGVNISQAVKMLEQIRADRALEAEQPKLNLPVDEPVQNAEQLRNLLYEACLSFDLEKVTELINMGFAMFHFEKMFHHVLAPLLQQIGDDWERGVVSVAQEHFTSNIILQRFHQFFQIFQTSPRLPKVLACCPQGEQHQIGLLLFMLFLRRNNTEVIYLGSDTPLEGLELVIEKNGIRVLALSLTDSRLLPDTEVLLDRLTARFPHLRVVLGGSGFQDVAERWQPMRLDGGMDEWTKWFRRELAAE